MRMREYLKMAPDTSKYSIKAKFFYYVHRFGFGKKNTYIKSCDPFNKSMRGKLVYT